MAKIPESLLYEPIKRFFEQRNCIVRAEVMDCDVVAIAADGTVFIIEMKSSCNLTVILQAVARMNIASFVYVAIPTPTRKQMPLWKELLSLCERVGIGLLTVTFINNGAFVTEQVVAGKSAVRTNKKRQSALVRETTARIGDFNVGGTNKTRRMTVYRQLALLSAAEIAENGPQSPKQLRAALLQDKVNTILQANVYGWFVRIRPGLYDVSDPGREALQTYADVLQEMKSIKYNNNN